MYVRGWGSVLTQHQSRDTEMDGLRNTCDGSSGQPGALLQTSYFTVNLQYTIFYHFIFGLGKTTKSQDRFPATQLETKIIGISDASKSDTLIELNPGITTPPPLFPTDRLLFRTSAAENLVHSCFLLPLSGSRCGKSDKRHGKIAEEWL
jgi:hypothetical protein